MQNLNIKIGESLKQLREAHNYSLTDIADKVGKSRKTIHAYEKGTIAISVSNLVNILDIYNQEVGRFLDNINKEN